jgi:hypothetical protein
MITSLTFENFRGFTDLKIAPLKGINLIAGANNTGKTGVLEGLYLLFAQRLDQVSDLPSAFRSNVAGTPQSYGDDDFPVFWESLFYDRQLQRPAKISGGLELKQEQLFCEIRGSQNSGLGFWYGQNPPLQNLFNIGLRTSGGNNNPWGRKFIVLSTRLEKPTRDADLYNQVTLLEGGEEKLLSLLQKVDPRVQKLRYAKAPGTTNPLVYAHFGYKNALCMTQTGQGFSKLFSLFCQMLVSKAEVLLIDEIENGLYYESLPQIWRGIQALAESEKIQVFATTHSRECILAAHETFKQTPNYDFALHRLQLVKGNIEAVTHDKAMLDVAFKSGMEIR